MKKFNALVYLVGGVTLLRPAFQYLEMDSNQRNCSGAERIRRVYNPDGKQWAVVTGSSEGIGKEFAMEMAKAGFNILLTSRSAQKLSLVENEIKVYHPNAEVRVVPTDLGSDLAPVLAQ